MLSTKKPDLPFSEGFTFHRPNTASNVLGYGQAEAGLLLPSKLVEKLLAESKQRIAEEEEAAELKRQTEIDDSRKALKTLGVLPAPPTAAKVLSQDQLIEAMKSAERVNPDPRHQHLVYSSESVSLFVNKLKTLSVDKDLRKRNEELATGLSLRDCTARWPGLKLI